jgi:hypothetical protein
MFLWFKETNGLLGLINIEQIVRIAPSGVSDSVCHVYLANGQNMAVDHSIGSIEKALAEVTNPSRAQNFRAVK